MLGLRILGTVCALWFTFLAIGMQIIMVVFMKHHTCLRFMTGKYHEGNVKRTLERDLNRAYNCWPYMQVKHIRGILNIVIGCPVHDCCSFPLYIIAACLHVIHLLVLQLLLFGFTYRFAYVWQFMQLPICSMCVSATAYKAHMIYVTVCIVSSPWLIYDITWPDLKHGPRSLASVLAEWWQP